MPPAQSTASEEVRINADVATEPNDVANICDTPSDHLPSVDSLDKNIRAEKAGRHLDATIESEHNYMIQPDVRVPIPEIAPKKRSFRTCYNWLERLRPSLGKQNQISKSGKLAERVEVNLLNAIIDALACWMDDIKYLGKITCRKRSCGLVFCNEVKMLHHWLDCYLLASYSSISTAIVNSKNKKMPTKEVEIDTVPVQGSDSNQRSQISVECDSGNSKNSQNATQPGKKDAIQENVKGSQKCGGSQQFTYSRFSMSRGNYGRLGKRCHDQDSVSVLSSDPNSSTNPKRSLFFKPSVSRANIPAGFRLAKRRNSGVNRNAASSQISAPPGMTDSFQENVCVSQKGDSVSRDSCSKNLSDVDAMSVLSLDLDTYSSSDSSDCNLTESERNLCVEPPEQNDSECSLKVKKILLPVVPKDVSCAPAVLQLAANRNSPNCSPIDTSRNSCSSNDLKRETVIQKRLLHAPTGQSEKQDPLKLHRNENFVKPKNDLLSPAGLQLAKTRNSSNESEGYLVIEGISHGCYSVEQSNTVTEPPSNNSANCSSSDIGSNSNSCTSNDPKREFVDEECSNSSLTLRNVFSHPEVELTKALKMEQKMEDQYQPDALSFNIILTANENSGMPSNLEKQETGNENDNKCEIKVEQSDFLEEVNFVEDETDDSVRQSHDDIYGSNSQRHDAVLDIEMSVLLKRQDIYEERSGLSESLGIDVAITHLEEVCNVATSLELNSVIELEMDMTTKPH